MNKVYFRVDSSKTIGLGHLMRCLTLAEEFKENDFEVVFISRSILDVGLSILEEKNIPLEKLPYNENFNVQANCSIYTEWLGASWETDAKETLGVIKSKDAFLVVDHYGIDERWEELIKPYVSKLIVIDDLKDRSHCCDLLVDQTYLRREAEYASLVPKDSKILTGTNYAILRPEFYKKRYLSFENKSISNGIKTILIYLGSGNQQEVLVGILFSILNIKWTSKIKIQVVGIVDAKRKKDFEELALKKMIHLEISDFHEHLVDLFLEADITFGAGGSSTWERCCLGLPTVLCQIADNQKYIVEELVNRGIVLKLDIKDDIDKGVRDIFSRLEKEKCLLRDLSQKSIQVVSGLGARLIYTEIMAQKDGSGDFVTLRLLDENDILMTWKWQCDSETRRFFFESKSPGMEEHRNWVLSSLSSMNRTLYMILKNNIPAGVLRVDLFERVRDAYVVSIYLNPKMVGVGVGSIAIEYVSNIYRDSLLYAEILKENFASLRAFEKAGFTKTEEQNLYKRSF